MLSAILHFAAYQVDSAVKFSDEQVAFGNAVLIFTFIVLPIFILLAYAINSFLLGKIFVKAGLPAWKAWVPMYNTWKSLEIGGQNGLWTLLLLVPLVNVIAVIFVMIAYYTIGKKLGKPSEFILWALFLPIVWLLILALDSSVWLDEDGTKPSPTPPSTPEPIV